MINRPHCVQAGVQTTQKVTLEKKRWDKKVALKKNNFKTKSSFQLLQISVLILRIYFLLIFFAFACTKGMTATDRRGDLTLPYLEMPLQFGTFSCSVCFCA